MANDHIDLTVEPGEIHALLGENGAGKSTLMNMLYGLITPDEGEIVIGRPDAADPDGELVDTVHRFQSPGDALDAGLGMVHQHFMLVPVFTVAENVILGRETSKGRTGLLDRDSARAAVREVSERYGLWVDPDALVEELPVGVQQRVEIIKALISDCELLILDEPTAVLTPQEINELLDIMRQLRDDGKSIVFISHKLKEVKAIADRITVIRRGKVVGETSPTASESELAAMMVGRDVRLTVEKEPASPDTPVLEISDLTVADDRGTHAVDGLSLTVRSGEIVGVAGVQGNGQTELAEAIMALAPTIGGTIRIAGDDMAHAKTHEIIEAGVGYIPEDRSLDGLVRDFTIAENLILNRYNRPPYARRGVLNAAEIQRRAADNIETFDVRTQSADHTAASLSGGNQQKVIVAREFSRPLKLLIAAQPTRGVDVGAMEFIHSRIVAERDSGAGVLVISSELDEVLALADRVAVMYDGKIIAEVSPDTPRDEIGLLMAGSTGDDEEAAGD
ncbi:nucleoside ABC transporter ATP-binding protein [Stackebrandtia albiflava]|uniref:Nucleoside ABC transporter ATP-binding protein n=1 Tax=Stackebrandtia albiflava TaxID=406432 RepID=A0A562V410_9ACTN|nr:ABC transporter ATP-binding protein [Stackebrandtia albiflava]TWJ12568.1 nucleoside ABC transporter ATP-binding protein [Stackebrandtia albiflava]